MSRIGFDPDRLNDLRPVCSAGWRDDDEDRIDQPIGTGDVGPLPGERRHVNERILDVGWDVRGAERLAGISRFAGQDRRADEWRVDRSEPQNLVGIQRLGDLRIKRLIAGHRLRWAL